VDSLLDPSAFGDAETSIPDSWPRRLRRALQPGLRARARLLELDAWRCAAVAVALCTAATLASAAWLWQARAQAAAASATAAINFLDGRLDEIDAQAQRLAAEVDAIAAVTAVATAGDLAATVGDDPCPRELTQRLLSSSLDGLLVRRWWLQGEFGAIACGPEGPTAALQLAPSNDSRLTLMSRRSIAAELLAVRAISRSQSIVALLDPRALTLPQQGPWQTDGATGERITLHAGDGRRLQVWSRDGAAGHSETLIQARQHSTRHGMAVGVDVDRAGFWADFRRQLPGVLAAALLFTGAIAAWAWRHGVRRARLVHRLERALRKRQFEPWVQPIVDLASGRCVGGEVLMRWLHPQRGIVSPGEFIEVAEQTGLIDGMSRLVMTRAAHRLAPLARLHPQLYFSFNLTPDQLRAPLIAQTLTELFNPQTLPREQVLLELTEREIVDPAAQGALAALHRGGWRIALDDFGTGHSSLALLERLPIQRLKIDRAFVASIGARSASRPVLDAIIGLARELKIGLIAEGVETQDQWDYLSARGVGSAQGYLMAKPMPLPAFEQWLAGHPSGTAAATAAATATATASASASASVAMPGTLDTPSATPQMPEQELQTLWQRMRSMGGLDIRDRVHHLRSYRQCFVAREAVDWLVRELKLSRTEATHIGRRLVALGWVRHVLDEHDFDDADLFFSAAVELQAAPVSPPADDLRQALRALDGGLALITHRRGLLVHRRCASGRRVVDWLVARHEVSRDTAVQWAAQLMRKGMLRHVFDEQPFRDDRTLYRPG